MILDRTKVDPKSEAETMGVVAAVARARDRLKDKRSAVQRIGLPAWLWLRAHLWLSKALRRSIVVRLAIPGIKHPVYLRTQTSDLVIFYQIFVDREYACFDDLKSPGLVVDCGGNVGYSSAYFLSRFPGCQVIVVEPDSTNFRALQRNLAAYGSRVRPIQAGVWSHPTGLRIVETPYRDGSECTYQVVECGPGEVPALTAVDIGGLLRDSGRARISLLKVDIEGAEAVVFASNYEPWIDQVDNIAIEIHDDTHFGDARGIFASAIAGRGFVLSESGELTIGNRVQVESSHAVRVKPDGS